MPDHTVKSFDEDLAQIKAMVAEMGRSVVRQLGEAIEALAHRDLQLSVAVIQEDQAIDALERSIEERAILTIARRQPVASDLRELMVANRVAADLERMGDLAKNLAKRAQAVQEGIPDQLLTGLSRMGVLAREELSRVLDAYDRSDAALALEVWHADEELDATYNGVFRELLTYMMEDPRNISLCTHLLFGAKNLERIGDHATNIAENVYYLVHGRQLADVRPKKDVTSSLRIEGA